MVIIILLQKGSGDIVRGDAREQSLIFNDTATRWENSSGNDCRKIIIYL